ncbi:MAG: hypothetical protein IT318_08520 [Anaerolineales bacterium]|nr:hypothetical protein [Anaerolineales bacterium]
MNRVGLYINASADEFLEWLATWARQNQTVPRQVAGGHVALGEPQRRILLNQHLVMEIPVTVEDIPDIPEVPSFALSFRILPVGLGASTEVIATCGLPELLPDLIRLVSEICERWPSGTDNVWFGQPRGSNVVVTNLRLKADIRQVDRELNEFCSRFENSDIRSVTVLAVANTHLLPAQDNRRPKARKWEIRLGLHHDTSWQGIDTISLNCEVSRISGNYPVRVVLTRAGVIYAEIGPFLAALTEHCNSTWDTSTGTQPSRDRRTRSAAGRNTQKHDLFGERKLSLDDRPWEMIADVAWDRLAVELWWKDYPCARIAERVSVTSKTVNNRLYELRKTYGTAIVPTELQRRGRGGEKLGYPG